MKQLLLLTAITMTAICAQAETRYCELTAWQPGFRRYIAEVNYNDTHTGKFKTIKNAAGKPMKFESKIDALNYMQQHGWELMTAFAKKGNETHFLMKKNG